MKVDITLKKEKKKDYLKGVFVYSEVSCCHVTEITSSATRREKSSLRLKPLNLLLFASTKILQGGIIIRRDFMESEGLCVT